MVNDKEVLGHKFFSLERELSREFRKNWKSWATFFEPGLGSDFGIPDVEVFVFKRCVHVELKVGVLAERNGGGSVVKSKNVRPAQIEWHRNADSFGVPCMFLFGVPTDDGGWMLYAGRIGEVAEKWKQGMVVGKDVEFIGLMGKDLSGALTGYIVDKVFN